MFEVWLQFTRQYTGLFFPMGTYFSMPNHGNVDRKRYSLCMADRYFIIYKPQISKLNKQISQKMCA